jgi:hypothetical protein
VKLFVWHQDAFRDYKFGMAFAIAESEEAARELLAYKSGLCPEDAGLDAPPDEVRELTEPVCFYVTGGS